MSPATPHPRPARRRRPVRRETAEKILGFALFAFIPVVLYLFVAHPEPLWGSLAAGVGLMLGHRFLARPYMGRVRERKCLWCNRMPPSGAGGDQGGAAEIPLATGAGLVRARTCPAHRLPAARFLGFVHTLRMPLRLGIFLPLLVLLVALGAAAAGAFEAAAGSVWVRGATAAFQLVVGITVSAAAWGFVGARVPVPGEEIPVPFPAHNFFLLGLRTLVWIFRLVGAWWIVRGVVGVAGLSL